MRFYFFFALLFVSVASLHAQEDEPRVVTDVSPPASGAEYEVSEAEVGRLYNDALEYLYSESYLRAAEAFEEVDREFPYSPWAAKAQLMSAFSYYMANDYENAVVSLDQFVNLNPSHRDVPYALYLKGICYYEQIRDVERDQENTLEALRAFNQVIKRHPDSAYGIDGRRKLSILVDNLAGKEMEIGRFYLGQGEYLAAINRFNSVLRDYSATLHVIEALHRLVESYMGLGLKEEAWRTAAVLGHNFPDSQWYQDSYILLEEHGLLKGDAKDETRLSFTQLQKQNLTLGKEDNLVDIWRDLLEGRRAQLQKRKARR